MRPRRFTFYLGVPEPSWLNRNDQVPKCVTAARFDRIKSGNRLDSKTNRDWPIRTVDDYIIDSGAYTALTGGTTTSPWWDDPEEYGSKILAFAENSGRPPKFCAPQDLPCEDDALAATGMTVADHQKITLENFLFLSEEWSFPRLFPWIPVLQGEEPEDYAVHEQMYLDAGVDLAACERVGVGSICNRAHVPEIVDVVERLAGRGYQLHGFGIKQTALPVIGHLLRSADSMAWSVAARYARTDTRDADCQHAGPCNNCYGYAKRWRRRVIDLMSPSPTGPRVKHVAAGLRRGDIVAAAALGFTGADRLLVVASARPVDVPGRVGIALQDAADALVPTHQGYLHATSAVDVVGRDPRGDRDRNSRADRYPLRDVEQLVDLDLAAKALAATTRTENTMTAPKLTIPDMTPAKGKDAVPGREVEGGEEFICPARGCGRKAKLRKADRKVGAHYKFGREKCSLAGQLLPADVPVSVLSRTAAAARQEAVNVQQSLEQMDELFAKLAGGGDVTSAAEPVDRRALPMVYDAREQANYDRKRHYPAALQNVRVDEFAKMRDQEEFEGQGYRGWVIASEGERIPARHVWSMKQLDGPGQVSQDGTTMWEIHTLIDGERGHTTGVYRLWGSQKITIQPGGCAGFGPGMFRIDEKAEVQTKHDGPWLRVTKITWGGVFVKGQKQIVAWSDIYAYRKWGNTIHPAPHESGLGHGTCNPQESFGFDGGEHRFVPTHAGSLRCRVCLDSIRWKGHTGVLNADFQGFEEIRQRLLQPGKTWQGRVYDTESLDRYVRGVPLVRHERDIEVQWNWVCPLSNLRSVDGTHCGGMRIGFATLRGLRAAWFEHVEQHHTDNSRDSWGRGYRAMWDDENFPVEKPIVWRQHSKPSRSSAEQPALVEVVEPRQDPEWTKVLGKLEAAGHTITRVEVGGGRRYPVVSIVLPGGTAAAHELRAALTEGGIPERDIKVQKMRRPKTPLSELLAKTSEPVVVVADALPGLDDFIAAMQERAAAAAPAPVDELDAFVNATAAAAEVAAVVAAFTKPARPAYVTLPAGWTGPERAKLPADTVIVLARGKYWNSEMRQTPNETLHIVNWGLPEVAYCRAEVVRTQKLYTGFVDYAVPEDLDGRDDARYGLPTESTCKSCRWSFEQYANREALPHKVLDPIKKARRDEREARRSQPGPDATDGEKMLLNVASKLPELDVRAMIVELREILAGYRGDVSQDLLLWAAGAMRIRSGFHFWQSAHSGDQMATWLPSGKSGEGVGGGVWFECYKGGFTLYPSYPANKAEAKAMWSDLGQVREHGWDQVLKFMNLSRVPAEIWQRVEELMADREACSPGRGYTEEHISSAPRDGESSAQWSYRMTIEGDLFKVAMEAWAAVRPA